MLLDRKNSIIVFQLDDEVFEQIGEVRYTSLMWADSYNGYDNFELWAPLDDDNAELIKKGNVLWVGGETAAVIEIVKQTVDDKGTKTFNAKGRTLEVFLTDRIVYGTVIGKGNASTIMYNIVNANCVNPSDINRKLKWLILADDTQSGKDIAQYQKTGGSVYDALVELATESDLGFSVIFDPYNKQLVFEVRQGIDRTEDNSDGNDPVVFGTELEDILSSEYYSSIQDEKNVAYVYGEDKGADRKSIVVGSGVSSAGYKRKELYVDARDLQTEVANDDGESTTLPLSEYLEILSQRGDEKLAEYPIVETFEAKIRQFGDVQYEYGESYFKGDKVTVIDKEIGISVSARITRVEETLSNQYTLSLTFGYSSPTLLQKVKRMTS